MNKLIHSRQKSNTQLFINDEESINSGRKIVTKKAFIKMICVIKRTSIIHFLLFFLLAFFFIFSILCAIDHFLFIQLLDSRQKRIKTMKPKYLCACVLTRETSFCHTYLIGKDAREQHNLDNRKRRRKMRKKGKKRKKSTDMFVIYIKISSSLFFFLSIFRHIQIDLNALNGGWQ